TLRSPRASMLAIASALLPAVRAALEQLLRRQPQPLDRLPDPRPLFGEELLPLALQQQIARADLHEHAEAAALLDELLVDELLIALEDGDWIDPVFGGDVARGRQRIAFVQHTVEYQRDHSVPQLAVNRLTVVPLAHPGSNSSTVIVNYNT